MVKKASGLRLQMEEGDPSEVFSYSFHLATIRDKEVIQLSLHIGNLIEQIVYGRLIIADFIIIGIYFAFKLVYLILH